MKYIIILASIFFFFKDNLLSSSENLPKGETFISGSASITKDTNSLTITQSSEKLVTNWQSFNIGQNHAVNFIQPSVDSVALNRITGSGASLIRGTLNSNGQVFLINPEGIIFSKTALVNVGGLVASTQDISNSNFLNNHFLFEGISQNSIINSGEISVKDKGHIFLLSAKIINEGQLNSNQGNINISAGSKFYIDFGDQLKLQVENKLLETLIENGGAITTADGNIYLTSQAASQIKSSVINNTGIIEAKNLSIDKNGDIILFAHGGETNVSGTIKSEKGFVETSGKYFNVLNNAQIIASEWLIDPINIDIDSTFASTIQTALGSGSVTIRTDGSCTGVTCSGSGSDGNIEVNSNLAWSTNNTLTLRADNNIEVNANLTHTGTIGGGVIFLYGQASANGGSSTYSATGTITSPSIQWRKGSDANSIRYAIFNGNYYMGNQYIELGVCGASSTACSTAGSGGKFGTSSTNPSLFFGRKTGSGIGMIGDADGFGVGTDLRIDYFLPGSPAEQFTIRAEGIADTLNFATAANSAEYAFSSLTSDNTIKLTYSGIKSNLKVQQGVSLKLDDKFFNNTVTLTNNSGSNIDNVYFARSFDPDNTVDQGGIYTTIQKIEQATKNGDSANVVSATSSEGDAYDNLIGSGNGDTAKIIYYSTNSSTKVGYGSVFFGGGSMGNMLSAESSLSKDSTGSGDVGIGIIFEAGTIAAGQSNSFSYLTSLDNRNVATILQELEVASDPTPEPTPTPTPTPTTTPRSEAPIKLAQRQEKIESKYEEKKSFLVSISRSLEKVEIAKADFGITIGSLDVVKLDVGLSAPGSLETKSIGGSSSDIIWRQIPSDVNQAPGQLNVFVANDGINLASENN